MKLYRVTWPTNTGGRDSFWTKDYAGMVAAFAVVKQHISGSVEVVEHELPQPSESWGCIPTPDVLRLLNDGEYESEPIVVVPE